MLDESNAACYVGRKVFLVGIKGTGMSALAELLRDAGAVVSGSDTAETFYTDEILDRLKIPYYEGFDPSRIDSSVDLVAHSAAYSPETCPDLIKAKSLGIPLRTYPQMLGELSLHRDSTGIAGVHGKSTTTAIAGTLIRALNLPASVIAGTAVPTFDDRSTLTLGKDFFVAETCEYRRHFLHFHPDRIVLTNIDLDHTDYFTDIEDIEEAFVSYGERLPPNGELIYCADDEGASRVVKRVAAIKPGLSLTPYGTTADGPFRLRDVNAGDGKIEFSLDALAMRLEMRIPGLHNVLNAAAAVALAISLVKNKNGVVDDSFTKLVAGALLEFSGSRRRSQIIGERDGILILDDYGHHPTAVSKTIQGFRSFYPGRRIIVDFMPHLYSRTKDLFDDFVTAFDAADVVILHEVYASARESSGGVTGADLYRAVREHHQNAHYFEAVADAEDFCFGLLSPDDVFITMGAGDNWKLGRKVLAGQR
jgi:UDP-N-acetylmuramate--alanine ligase